MKTYSTFEYSEVEYRITDDGEERVENNVLYLKEKSVEYLEKLNVAQVLRNKIKFQNYAGVISFEDIRLEILPKFLRTDKKLVKPEEIDEKREKILQNLVRMLEYSGWEGIKETDLTQIGTEKDFFEIYVFLFAKNLAELLKVNRDASYVRTYDELRFVRGKIEFRKYWNPARLHIIPCSYYERNMNTPINRTLKFVSYLLLKKVESSETRRLLKSVISVLDSVTLSPVTLAEVEKITFNRLNSRFIPFIDFCRAFLRDSVFSLQGSDVEFFSFLIPMETLFERFVAKAVKELYKGTEWKPHIQETFGYLVPKEKLFQLQPDIVLENGGERVIVDTKYKILDPEDRKLGVSQQDLYQMYAYCKELGSSKCVLIYPESLNGKIDGEFKLGSKEKIDLKVKTISLENPFDNGKLSENFKESLRNAIGLL
ncbi:5-methylcytosine restriction system component-like protein [Ferroglobus placidus DSM 10642]|uniref:5-methylcytosine restriction system component-like protein n=1 Tax=Ferroglobus placidus (strain DSM 10642 / AEDII12DO) TaxID=589924 RepID=D3RX20_FERPA|nr:5-methylcytosine restriction system component-like protein [Ferroglobus placidus]ADC65033.1 5-methylcytosine restriction system component-like protein [Ferroglobus placidus DSM 10642]